MEVLHDIAIWTNCSVHSIRLCIMHRRHRALTLQLLLLLLLFLLFLHSDHVLFWITCEQQASEHGEAARSELEALLGLSVFAGVQRLEDREDDAKIGKKAWRRTRIGTWRKKREQTKKERRRERCQGQAGTRNEEEKKQGKCTSATAKERRPKERGTRCATCTSVFSTSSFEDACCSRAWACGARFPRESWAGTREGGKGPPRQPRTHVRREGAADCRPAGYCTTRVRAGENVCLDE